MPNSRHRFNYRWYNPLPRDMWDMQQCSHCLTPQSVRWYKETRFALSARHQDIVWPTDPVDAPSLLCDACYGNYCGGVTRDRRIWSEITHGTPTGDRVRISNHIKRRLP